MPNVAAILMGRVDLRVDRQQFRNNMEIKDSLSAVSHASLSRIGTGRHGGRPSQEPKANTVASGLIPRFVGTESWRKASRYNYLGAANVFFNSSYFTHR